MASNNSSLSRRAWSSSNTLSGGVNEYKHAPPSQSKTFANNSVPILCDSEVESNDEEEEQACSRFVAIIKNDEHKESLELSEDRPKASIKSWFVQSAKCINNEDVENTEGVKLSKDQVKRFQKSGNREKFYEDECTDQASLQKLLKTSPALYKRCHLQIDSAHRSVAKVLDGKDSKCTEIAILGRSKCGRSYNEDEVVVKVLDPADQRLGSRTAPCDTIAEKTNAQTITHGQVIGRLKRVRYANVDHPVLICTLDEIEGHLMKPICKTVPKIHVLNDTVRRENPALVKHCIEIKEISSNGWVKFKRIVNIEASKREQYVFKVAILAWRQESIYPLGAVLEIHAAGRDYAGGLKVLYMQQRVPTTYPLSVVRHTRSLLQSKIKKRMKGRRDLSDKQVFTIDPPTAEDLDDALSVWKEKGHFVVGVHIADVAELIKERTNTDMEARKRGVTFYPLDRKPHPMLPEPISHGICSLLSNKRRLTLSVFFTFDSHFKLLGTIEPKVEKTVIKSKRQFSYEEVQKIINGTQTKDINDSLSTDIHRLHKIASNLSESRKQNSRMYVPFEDPRLEDLHTVYNSLEAHALVEEFMILTNAYIAKRLSSTFPELMILRCQKAPTYDSLAEWRKKQNSIGDLVMQLQGKKITPETRLSISNPELSSMTLHPTHVFVQEDLWRMLCQSMKSGNIPKARKLAFMDSLHPLQCLATHQWMEMMESAEYKCSHGLNQPDHLHYGLDLSHYTHFTSPLRRYADLHVQRLLHADLDGRTPECTTDDVQQLCLHINGVTARQKAFERGCMALKIADGLQNRPLTFRAYVQHVDTEQLTLCVPSLQAVADRKQELPFSVLGVSSQPVLTADIVSVTWNMRIYNALASTQGQEGPLLSEKNVGKERKKTFPSSADISINRHQLSVCVKQSNWAQILTSLITSEQCQGVDWQSLKEVDESGEKRISSEEGDGTLSSRPGRFKMAYSTGLVLQIQMTSEPCKGLLKPRVELMHIARNITVCLRHVKDPVTALARFATRTTRRQTFTCYDDYVRAWMPLLEMEAACGAGNSDSTVVVENVHIFMNKGGKAGSDYFGYFQLPYKFCFDRDIEFGGGLYDDLDEGEPSCPVGYLCIRYRLKCDTATVSRVQQSDLETCIDDHYTWVGHASITSVKHKHSTADDGGVMHVKFILNEKNPQPPHEMTSSKGEIVMIEILQKSEVDKRAQKMLLQLDSKEKSLAQSIAYGSDFPRLDEDHLRLGSDSRYHEVESALFTKKIKEGKEAFGLPRNNQPQRKAIKTALKNTLSLIQGPPGTGKTYTGMKLVYLFSKINRQLAEKGNGKGDDKKRKIVLYCGPSNKSVDLVARLLKQRLGDSCPKILRVYGSAIESKDYPVPRGNLRSSRSMRDLKSDLSLQDVTLHHIIRDENPHAEEIVSFDKIFEKCLKDPEKFKVTSTQLKEYHKLLFEASVEEISKGYEVILTTCAVAGSRRIIRGTNGNIFQVIIDECAMSPEPHCLVPIIANKAKQVVLIGDHKQLRPIIKCQPAAELGLDQSLFKRLFKNLQENLKVFLSDQYRMHKKICEFPSEVFYKGKLKTKTHRQKSLGFWPREKRTGKEVPHILIDVRGEEETLTVSSDEGNERSKSNKMEAEKVVEVFKFLKKEFNVETSTIRVLTQYNAQRHLLEQKLLTLCDDREENVFTRYDKAKLKVTTVVSSQGSESDYVILSTVRSLPSFKIEPRPTYGWCRQNLGFITDRNQVNVALTRAKFGLIIVGNIELLQCDAVWRQLIERYRDEGCIYGCDEFPPRLSQPTPSLQRMQSDGRTRFR